jgi:hypothetical protein
VSADVAAAQQQRAALQSQVDAKQHELEEKKVRPLSLPLVVGE